MWRLDRRNRIRQSRGARLQILNLGARLRMLGEVRLDPFLFLLGECVEHIKGKQFFDAWVHVILQTLLVPILLVISVTPTGHGYGSCPALRRSLLQSPVASFRKNKPSQSPVAGRLAKSPRPCAPLYSEESTAPVPRHPYRDQALHPE